MLLRHPSTFRRLWAGQSISVVGDGMQRIALLWWAKHQGGNGLLVAVALATMVPVVLCSPLGGSWADRLGRRTLMLGADAARLVTSVLLASLLFSGNAPELVVCALVALAGVATAVFDPAYATAVPTIVDDADLPAANGLNLANSAVGGLLGPLLGGVLIGVAGIGWVMVVNAATFAWSAAFVAATSLPRPTRRAEVPSTAGSTAGRSRGGVRTSLDQLRVVPGLGRLLGLGATLNMVVAPVPMLIVALSIDRFHATAATFGVFEMLLSAGLLVGSLGAGLLSRGRITAPMVVLGACLAAAGALPLVGSGAALALGGVAIAVANTDLMTSFQRAVPAEVRGRVFGVVGSMSEGLRPAGLAAGGPLLALAGVAWSFAVVGAAVVAATLAWGRGALPSAAGVATTAPVALDGQADELVDQGRVRQAAGDPELGVHRDRREAGDRVDLVAQEASTAGPVLVEEVHAGHPVAPEQAEDLDGQALHLGGRVGVEASGDDGL